MATPDFSAERPCRILSLDGGGAKGFYTLGVLREIEGLIGCRLHEKFDLIFGTSTGAIIASLLALGHSVEEIHMLYKQYVPTIMKQKTPTEKSAALAKLAVEVFGDAKFDAVKTGVGVVTTRWEIERPMIFKGNVVQAHGRVGMEVLAAKALRVAAFRSHRCEDARQSVLLAVMGFDAAVEVGKRSHRCHRCRRRQSSRIPASLPSACQRARCLAMV